MNPRSKQLVLASAVIIGGFVAVYFLSTFVSARRISLPENYADSDLAFQGGRLKGWALGAEGLLADWYWMWSLQYMGTKIVNADQEELNLDDLSALNPRLLYPLLDNTTDLDPRFMPPYSYGASVLPAIDKEKAIALTEKGIERNPEAWRLYQYLGYIHWHSKNYEAAAEAYESGSQIAGAPVFMKQMAGAMRTAGGSRETARQIYRAIIEQAEDQQSRINAERRLMEIDSLEEREAIDAVLARVRERTGRCPTLTREILVLLRDQKLPGGNTFRVNADGLVVDPMNYPYTVERETCTAKLSAASAIPRTSQ